MRDKIEQILSDYDTHRDPDKACSDLEKVFTGHVSGLLGRIDELEIELQSVKDDLYDANEMLH